MNGICVKSFLLAALIVLMGAAVQAEPVAKRLRIGTDATYPPYEFTSPAGAIAGFEPDLIMNLCARMKSSASSRRSTGTVSFQNSKAVTLI